MTSKLLLLLLAVLHSGISNSFEHPVHLQARNTNTDLPENNALGHVGQLVGSVGLGAAGQQFGGPVLGTIGSNVGGLVGLNVGNAAGNIVRSVGVNVGHAAGNIVTELPNAIGIPNLGGNTPGKGLGPALGSPLFGGGGHKAGQSSGGVGNFIANPVTALTGLVGQGAAGNLLSAPVNAIGGMLGGQGVGNLNLGAGNPLSGLIGKIPGANGLTNILPKAKNIILPGATHAAAQTVPQPVDQTVPQPADQNAGQNAV